MQRTLALDPVAPPIFDIGRSDKPLDIPGLLHPLDWASLPSTLRHRFEAGHGAARYAGSMTFERSTVGLAFAWLSRVFGAPLPSHRAINAPVTVEVYTEGPGVAWSRKLGPSHLVRSVKSPGPGGTVLERTDGGLGMVLDVLVQDGALVFASRSFFLAVGRWRVPVPSLLTPGRCRVEHRAVDDTRFRFTLTMTHKLWGTTFRQTGVFADGQEGVR